MRWSRLKCNLFLAIKYAKCVFPSSSNGREALELLLESFVHSSQSGRQAGGLCSQMKMKGLTSTIVTCYDTLVKKCHHLYSRYQSSRYIDCQCPPDFEGQRCEKVKSTQETADVNEEGQNDGAKGNNQCQRKSLTFQFLRL